MKIYFVRHGESEANLLRVISNRGRIHGLTNTGIEQARQLASHFRDLPDLRIFSSPLLRAIQTAQLLAGELKTAMTIIDALREYDCGDLEGQSDQAAWEAHAALREAWLVRREWHLRRPGGENFFDIRDRFVPFLHELLDADDPRPILMVGHGGTYMCILPLVLNNISFDEIYNLPFPNTGYVLAESTPEGLVCKEWCGITKDR